MQPSAKSIRAAAAYGGLTLDKPENYVHKDTNKTEAFRSKFISAQVPAFEDHEGFCIFESVAILRYVASLAPNAKLLGNGPKDAALVDQWISFVDNEMDQPFNVMANITNATSVPYNKATEVFYREKGMRSVATLEKHLSTRTFLVGDRITIADIFAAAALQICYRFVLDPEHRKHNPNTLRFLNTIVNQASMKSVFGEVVLCEKTMQYTPPPKGAKDAKTAASGPGKTE